MAEFSRRAKSDCGATAHAQLALKKHAIHNNILQPKNSYFKNMTLL